LSQTPTWSMTPAEQAEVLVASRAQRARWAELELRVLVAADRNAVGSDAGATSTAAWLADATGSTRAACFRDVRLAHALDGEFDATRRALAAGTIDVERACVIVRAVEALTEEHEEMPGETRVAAEAHLLDLAARFDAKTLVRLGKRLFEVVCPKAAEAAEGRILAREEEMARRLTYVTMQDNGDGTSEGRFRVPTLHAHLLRKALETLTSPRRLGEGRMDPGTGKPLPHSNVLGKGFLELLERHLNLDTLPSAGGSPFTVVVTVALDALRAGLGIAEAETGHRISAGEVRRLACRAGIIPMVLGGASEPLDLGRERRLFSKHQRIALNHQYGGCAATNCDRPSAWTEAHHEHAWAKGGRTDLARGIPLCPPHHHMADHPDSWDMRRLPTGGVRFTRRQ
jgi:Domain of unknown function (DUF222)